MVTQQDPHVDTGTLILGDISGYTTFLERVTEAHPEMTGVGGDVPPAYPVITSLLDVVVQRIEPPFVLAEIEGDAVFGYALGDRLSCQGEEVLDVVRSAYGAFRERIQEAMILQNHDCQACMVLPNLDLKFVLHHGSVVVHRIAGRPRLLSPAVNVAHGLLKNSIAERTGRRGYLFVTDAAVEHLGPMPATGVPHEEHYPDASPVKGTVIVLDPAAG